MVNVLKPVLAVAVLTSQEDWKTGALGQNACSDEDAERAKEAAAAPK